MVPPRYADAVKKPPAHESTPPPTPDAPTSGTRVVKRPLGLAGGEVRILADFDTLPADMARALGAVRTMNSPKPGAAPE